MSFRHVDRVIVDCESMTGCEVAASIFVLSGQGDEPVSEVAIVVDRLPAVVNVIVVVHRDDLLRVELRAHERVVWAFHSRDKGVTADWVC